MKLTNVALATLIALPTFVFAELIVTTSTGTSNPTVSSLGGTIVFDLDVVNNGRETTSFHYYENIVFPDGHISSYSNQVSTSLEPTEMFSGTNLEVSVPAEFNAGTYNYVLAVYDENSGITHSSNFNFNKLASGIFIPSGPKFVGDAHRWDTQNGNTYDVAFGDVDGDGDLDFLTANSGNLQETKVYTNDGVGNYTDSNQQIATPHGRSVALGDIDNDGDLDAVVAQGGARKPNKVYVNNGSGQFTDSGQNLGNNDTRSVVLGDVDGDGDLDMAVANDYNSNNIYLNDGQGGFSLFYQTPTTFQSKDIDLGDIDGDGDLDMVIANTGRQFVQKGPFYFKENRVFFNAGDGSFTESSQKLGNQRTKSVTLGDIDNDGDLDLIAGNGGEGSTNSTFDRANKIYLNNGNGTFQTQGIAFGDGRTWDIELGDIDLDGDIDVIESNFYLPTLSNTVYINDGAGNLVDSEQLIDPNANTFSTALGDVDGDGDLDMLIGNLGYNTILINE